MGFTEKSYIGVIITTLAVAGWYMAEAFAAASAGQTSIAEFGPTMWTVMGVYVVLIIAVMIVTAILSKGEGEEMGEFDERDQLIDMRAERTGSYAQSVGLFGLLVMLTMEVSAFALANTIMGIMAFATILTFALRLYYYRRGA